MHATAVRHGLVAGVRNTWRYVMFGPFSKPLCGHRPVINPLGVERLEARDCPALILTLGGIAYGGQDEVTITGTVVGSFNPLTQIAFQGPVYGNTTPDADGNWSFTTKANAVGEMSVQAHAPTQSSNLVLGDIVNNQPAIVSFHGQGGTTEPTEKYWSFWGTVEDEDPEGLVVIFSGAIGSLNSKHAVVAADGTFSVNVTLAPVEEGNAYANVADWYDLTDSSDPITVVRA